MIRVGDRIRIIYMEGEPQYKGKEGVVEYIDDAGQLHGTWGGCALIPNVDKYVVIKNKQNYTLKAGEINMLLLFVYIKNNIMYNIFKITSS